MTNTTFRAIIKKKKERGIGWLENYKRRDILEMNLGSPNGSVQGGVRPCIVVSNDAGNTFGPTLVVVPLTSSKSKANLPTHGEINKNKVQCLKYDSTFLAEQMRPVDKSQVMRKIGGLPYDLMAAVDVGVLIELGLHREERRFA